MSKKKKLKVFISYSWDNKSHKAYIRKLADRLNKDGLNTELDIYVTGSPKEGWTAWMQNQFDSATHVLIVWTKTYHNRFMGKEDEGIGLGAKWESLLTRTYLSGNNSQNEKLIPIVLKTKDLNYIPSPYNDYTAYDLSTDEGYNNLKQHILNIPKYQKPTPTTDYSQELESDLPPSSQAIKIQKKDSEDFSSSCMEGGKHFIVVADVSDEMKDLEDDLSCSIDEKNYIDQKCLYITHKDRENWKSLIHSPFYSTHNKSKNALEVFLNNSYWKELATETDRVIDLGVGTGEKSILILGSYFTHTTNKLNYVIVDSSFPMLENSLKYISHDVTNLYPSRENQYKLVALKTDFMKLEKSRQCFQGNSNKKSVFFMLGGTFCNLNENHFLDSLKRVMRKEDTFIVGVGLINSQSNNAKSYDNEPIHNMLTSPLKKLGYKIIDKKLKVQWVTGTKDTWSVVKNTKTLLMKITIEVSKNIEQEIVLQSASRYLYHDLKEHIENQNFTLKDEAYNNERDFIYLAFEYQGE